MNLERHYGFLAAVSVTWGQTYKTFYGRNLQNSVKARVLVPGKPFQPSLMFVGKAKSLP